MFQSYEEGFQGQILHADGKAIVEEMRQKMTEVFNKNIKAVQVGTNILSPNFNQIVHTPTYIPTY